RRWLLVGRPPGYSRNCASSAPMGVWHYVAASAPRRRRSRPSTISGSESAPPANVFVIALGHEVCDCSRSHGKGVMERDTWWKCQSTSPENQRKFDRWLKANAILSRIPALGMLAMALAAITTSPRFSNVAAGKSNELAADAAGRDSAGVNPRPTNRGQLVRHARWHRQPSR